MEQISKKHLDKLQNAVSPQSTREEKVESYTSEKIKNLQQFLNCVSKEEDYLEQEQQQQSLAPYGNNEYKDNLSVKLHEKEKLILQLKRQIDSIKNDNKALLQQLDYQIQQCQEREKNYCSQCEKKLLDQKTELESVIEKHLKFIDQLILDKKDLNNQNEVLALELKLKEEKHNKAINDVREKYLKDMQANKDAWMAADKAKKDNWLQEKTQEIKEQNLKQFEKELERIIAKNKVDQRKLEEKFKKEKEISKLQMQQEYDEKFKQFKEKINLENQEILEKTKLSYKQELKDQANNLQQEFQEDKLRLKKNHEEEMNMLEEKRRKEADEYIKKIKQINDQLIEEVNTGKIKYEKIIEENKKEFKQEMAYQKEKIKIEQERWMENILSQQKEEIDKKVRDISKRLEKERDQQIEVILDKISNENTQFEDTLKKKNAEIIKEVQRQCQEEVKTLKRDLRFLEDKEQKSKLLATEQEQQIKNLGVKIQELTYLAEQKDTSMRLLQNEIDAARQKANQVDFLLKEQECKIKLQFEEERKKYDETISQLQTDINNMKIENQIFLNQIEEKHASQLEGVEERIKNIILKKDTLIQKLKEDIKLKDTKCLKFEQLLEKQRKDLTTQ